MGAGLRSGDGFGNGMIGLGGLGTAVGYTVGKDSTIRQFSKIARTSSIAASWESHRLLGTSLSASDKKYMACAILSSAVTLGCLRCSCKYSAVSVISSSFVLLSISSMQR